MSQVLKIAYLTAHVAASAFTLALIFMGFEMVHMRDGSDNNPGATIAGFLTLLISALTAIPLIAAVATKWVNRWWLAAHWVLGAAAVLLTVYAILFEEPGSADRG
ncbi:hypothetical protein [Actinomadura sp. 21ATH]|uniref:hypothetical protein n=1 Tax=Actinomadura sp. 21ATH TaxID=1735444 RepID=UPI0035C075C7